MGWMVEIVKIPMLTTSDTSLLIPRTKLEAPAKNTTWKLMWRLLTSEIVIKITDMSAELPAVCQRNKLYTLRDQIIVAFCVFMGFVDSIKILACIVQSTISGCRLCILTSICHLTHTWINHCGNTQRVHLNFTRILVDYKNSWSDLRDRILQISIQTFALNISVFGVNHSCHFRVMVLSCTDLGWFG